MKSFPQTQLSLGHYLYASAGALALTWQVQVAADELASRVVDRPLPPRADGRAQDHVGHPAVLGQAHVPGLAHRTEDYVATAGPRGGTGRGLPISS